MNDCAAALVIGAVEGVTVMRQRMDLPPASSDAGFAEYLVKPFEVTALVRAIEQGDGGRLHN